MTPDEAKQKLIDGCLILEREGHHDMTRGHLSVRVPGKPDTFYMKPHSHGFDEVTMENIVVCNIEGEKIGGGGPRHSEVFIHSEIFRIRPDVNAVIHLHHDEMIAFMACGYDKIRSFSLTYGFLMQKPAYYLPASINVEEDVGPIKDFIAGTNCIIMKRHGFTVLGRTVSEAYHRTCVLVSEIKRNIIVEQLCAATGRTAEDVTDEEMAYMASHGDSVMYPKVVKKAG